MNIQTIPKRNQFSPCPLSFAQEMLWFLDQLQPDNRAYNQPKAFRLSGVLNRAVLKQAFTALIARHEVLRTTFQSIEGQPIQVIGPCQSIELPIIDLRTLRPEAREAELTRCILEVTNLRFDLSQDLMMRAALFCLTEHEHVLLIVVHHIASDGWSMGVLFSELSLLYEAFVANKPSPLPDLPIQYADWAVWQRHWLRGEIFDKHLSYWKKQLTGVSSLQLPTDRLRPAIQTFRGGREVYILPEALMRRLKDLARSERMTLFMTLLTAFQLLLHRYAGNPDIAVGSPITGRTHMETQGLIGFFVNTLVLRTDVSGNPTFRELLKRVRETAVNAFMHPDVPFEKLIAELKLERSLSRNTMFQVMFALQNYPKQALKISGVHVEPLDIEKGTTKFDVTVAASDEQNGLRLLFEYNVDLFESVTIQRMLHHFENLLERLVANPEVTISGISLLGAVERDQLLEWNNTCCDFPQGKSVHELFEAQVRRASDATAVILEGERLSYGELNRRANQLAGRLRTLGVGPGVMVGLCLERSLEMIVGVLGILKAGGAYVPLDPAYPIGRLAFMLEDTQAPVLLTQQKLLRELIKDRAIQPLFSAAEGEKAGISQFSVVDRRITVLCLDADWQDIAQESEENPPTGVNAEDLAYLIYTSGSTGKPKGVEITHRALANFVHHTGNALALDGADRVLQFASISFDTAAEEIFPCLIRGATLVLRTECMIDSVAVFLEKCLEWGVTVLDLPTVYWHELIEGLSTQSLTIPESLRLVIIGGERADPERLAQWWSAIGDRVRLLNTYGPTEATVVATTWEANGANPIAQPLREVPIGRPIANVQTYILDQYLNPVPIGVRGELYIGGEGVAAGYLNCPDLTADRFIPDPFSPVSGARLYKTGDLARYLSDGNIEFIGRLDHQVKIRGFRIELGEIEAIIRQNSLVKEAVVVDSHEEAANHNSRSCSESNLTIENPISANRLVAYIVLNAPNIITESDLRAFLKDKVPHYMIPSAFVFLKTLPLTPNGKVDRRALPVPDSSTLEPEPTFVAPRTPLEEILSGIWAEVLKMERVSVHDNFFDLGGHSLLATRLMAKLNTHLNSNISLRVLFENPTVASIAIAILKESEDRAGIERTAQLLLKVARLSSDEVETLLSDKLSLRREN